jgi:hypothetical protein
MRQRVESVARGYEKRDIALRQLRRAVQLFNQRDFVCATTLAGAAEEVFGRIAQKRTGTTALDGHAHRKKVAEAHNRLRNQLKHNDSGDNEWVTADFELEAQDLIGRAIGNYCLAYGIPPGDRIINYYVNFYWS